MANSILVVSGSYHLGDNPGIFQNSTYVGHQLVLPVRKTWLDERADKFAFYFSTQDVETLGNLKGHRVTINGTDIGRIKNTGGTAGTSETMKLEVKRDDLLKILNEKDNFTLAIEYEKQLGMPGLGDDFVLTRIATSENLSVALGWK